jgi:phosphatidylglycerophosphate synthase
VSPGGVLTWANALTLNRLLLCLPLYLFISSASWLWASVCLFFAVLSDIFDGKVARKQGNTSPLGGFFDHATDAILVTTSCVALAQSELISFWLAWLIPAAFIQYSLDSRILSGHALRSSALGRANGIGYFVLVCCTVGSHLLGWTWLQSIIPMFSWALVASTVVSIADRLQATIRATRLQ